jgi:hypothetical protein
MADAHAPAASAGIDEADLYGDLDAPAGSAVLAAEVAEARAQRRCLRTHRHVLKCFERVSDARAWHGGAVQLRARARSLAEALAGAEARCAAAEAQRDALALNISRIFRVSASAAHSKKRVKLMRLPVCTADCEG